MKNYMKVFAAVLFAACLTTTAQTTKLLFSRQQFQAHQATAQTPPYMLTVPLVYKGTASIVADAIQGADEKCVVTEKVSYKMYMTMCQPCFDCYPCQFIETETSDEALDMNGYGQAAVDPGKITKWNLYIVKETSKAKKAEIVKIDLTDAEESVFFTGPNKGVAVVQGVASPAFFMSGKKNDYKFNYVPALITSAEGDWELVDNKKQTAYIKSVSAFTGRFSTSAIDVDNNEGVNFNCTIKMTRDASLTKSAVENVFQTEIPKKAANWSDCAVETPAGICEKNYASGWDEDEDQFDAYLAKTYDKKKWEIEVTDDTTFAGGLDELSEF